jgi:FKBP-type peptidyl-prolyl cis-trans isomerase FkpA
MRILPMILGVALAISACDSPTDPNRFADPERITYAQSLGINLSAMTRTASGMYYQDTQVGTGARPQPGDSIRVHYTGWLPDGTRFDTSRGGAPIEYRHGRGRVIPGWEEALATMNVGGMRKVVLPPSLGYGAYRVGPIPPNSTLVFEIELVRIF